MPSVVGSVLSEASKYKYTDPFLLSGLIFFQNSVLESLLDSNLSYLLEEKVNDGFCYLLGRAAVELDPIYVKSLESADEQFKQSNFVIFCNALALGLPNVFGAAGIYSKKAKTSEIYDNILRITQKVKQVPVPELSINFLQSPFAFKLLKEYLSFFSKLNERPLEQKPNKKTMK
jgi:hypothetical protein